MFTYKATAISLLGESPKTVVFRVDNSELKCLFFWETFQYWHVGGHRSIRTE
jgi:hypothetical protein